MLRSVLVISLVLLVVRPLTAGPASLEEARELVGESRIVEARAALQGLLASSETGESERQSAEAMLAHCLHRLEEHGAVIALVEGALQERPSHSQRRRLLTRKAYAQYGLKQWEAAAQTYGLLLSEGDPSSDRVMLAYYHAYCLNQQGQHEEAQRAVDAHQGMESPYAERLAFMDGWIAYSRKDWKEAARKLEPFIDRYPEARQRSRAEAALCYSLRNTWQWDRLATASAAALDRDPEHPQREQLLLDRARSAYKLGEWEVAARHYGLLLEELTEADPLVVSARLHMGAALLQQADQMRVAAEDSETIAELDAQGRAALVMVADDPAQPLLRRLDASYHLGQLERVQVLAVAALRDTESLDAGTHAGVMNWLGVVAANQMEPDLAAARQSFGQALSSYGLTPEMSANHPALALFWLCWFAAQEGDLEQIRDYVGQLEALPECEQREVALRRFGPMVSKGDEAQSEEQ